MYVFQASLLSVCLVPFFQADLASEDKAHLSGVPHGDQLYGLGLALHANIIARKILAKSMHSSSSFCALLSVKKTKKIKVFNTKSS
jgi:hypothetical protein